VSEAGVPGYEAVIWLGVMAPKGTPPAIVKQAQRGDREGRQSAGDARGVGEAGRIGHDDAARRVLEIRRGDIAKWEKGDQGLGRQARPVARPI
jgi:hypothetical protein